MNLPPRCPPLPAHCPPPYPRPPRREGVRAVVMHMVLCRLTVLYTVSRYTGPSLGVCKTCIHLVACGLCKCLCACACALFVCSFLFCVHLAFDVSCVASCDRWERAPCAAAGRRQGADRRRRETRWGWVEWELLRASQRFERHCWSQTVISLPVLRAAIRP